MKTSDRPDLMTRLPTRGRSKATALAFLFACLLAFPITSLATAADGLIASPEPGWPQWRGPRRDGISSEEGLLPVWPDGGPELLWKIDGLGSGWSSPIVVDKRVYITGDVQDDLVMFAIDTNGKLIWRTANGKAWKKSYPGSRASCTFSEGRLYHLNAHGRLACLDAGLGKEYWASDILKRFDAENGIWGLSESLLVEGDRVIVTPGGKNALVAALDKQDGRTVWTTEPLGDDTGTHSSPVLFEHAGHRMIANCSSGHGFGIDADSGQLLWTVPLKNRFGVNVSTPVFGRGSVFFVTPYAEEGRLYRLGSDRQSTAAELAWQSPLDTVCGCAVLVDDTLFAAEYRKSKQWFATDWQSGERKSQLEHFSTGAAIFADGRLYLLDETGTVGLVKTAPTIETAGRFRLFEDRVRDAWAHPVLCDGRLYLRYHDTLWCFDVERR